MSLAPGSSIGPYTIVAAIGAGGMGVVYRATDTRLGRDVAIKVLPDEVAANPDRLARFEREARALAALTHFNVAQIYGFEGRALVMELLEGETLRERLTRGQLPIRKAIEYATQIARGLAAAHDRGIVHRDLKPENVFIVQDGHLKLLDFGLARRDTELASIDTQTARHSTAPGTILGTVGYMSPEQVRGLPVDGRSDLFSLGAVLYEMLTGTRAFRGSSSADTMASILNEQPRELSAARPDVGPALDRIVQHCLEKNPLERFQSARDVAFALDSLSGSATSVPGLPPGGRTWPRERLAWGALTAVLVAVLAWQSLARRTPPSSPPAVSRTLLVLPEGVSVNEMAAHGARMAISPDGSRLALHGRYDTTGQSQLFLLSLDGTEGTPIAGTESASAPFWSPDGRQLMFSAAGNLVRLPLDGGGPVTVTKGVTTFFTSGTWNADGIVLIGGGALQQVSIHDGAVSIVHAGVNNERFGAPHFLPDGRRFVFSRFAGSDESSVVAGSLGTTSTHVVLSGPDLGRAIYANGALLYTRGATLFAQRAALEPTRLEGDAVAVATAVESSPTRGGAFTASANGVVVFQAAARATLRLTWLDREGRTLSTIGDDADYSNVELDRDGRRALVSITDPRLQTRDIFIIDLTRGVRQRFTIDPSDERSAIWSPDGRGVLYTSKGLDLYSRAADSSGDEQRVIVDGVSKDPYDWSRDGRMVLYRRSGPGATNDIWIAPADGSGPGRAIADTPFAELPGNFSPDGRFIVYASEESGQSEVYVMNIQGGGKIQVSTKGGVFPRWRGDGREIVYIGLDRSVMSAAVKPGAEVAVSAPRPLFRMNVTVMSGRMYDVTRDGQRFLAAIPVPSRIPPSLEVISNWPRLLEKN